MIKTSFMRNLFFLFLAFSAMSLLKNVFARHESIKSERRFNRMLRNPRYNLAIILFYESEKRMRRDNRDLYQKIQNLKEMFKSTSKVFRYDDADVLFMTVNLTRPKNEDLRSAYNIGSTPVFMLFKDGYPYKDNSGNKAILQGFAIRPQLQKFIDRNFCEAIAKNRTRNRRIREKRMEEAQTRAYYWGPGWGGWGYGGWGPGFGWGGYAGYGWGYGGYGRGCCRSRGCCARRCR